MSESQPQRKRKRAVLEAVQEDGNSKFARALGSLDHQTREKGLQALTTWLSKRDDISEQEMKKLWKGIFYCFWHADRPAFQADLATRLAGNLPLLPSNTAFLYFSVFLETMRREWFGIDRLRLDKFMMLVRKFVHAIFQSLQAQRWDLEAVNRVMSCLQQDVLLNTDSHPAAGLMYHLADVFAVELREVCRAGPPPAAALGALVEPFCQVMAKTQRAPFLARLREAFFDVLIQEAASPSEKLPFKHLAIDKLANHLFQLGALPETKARNRQELYDTSKAFEQAHKTRLRKQGKLQRVGANPVEAVSSDQPLANGHSKKKKQQKAQTGGNVQDVAQHAHAQANAPEAALLNKALLKKQRKAAAAATAAQAGPAQVAQPVEQTKQVASSQPQQQQPALPEATAPLDTLASKRSKKKHTKSSLALGMTGPTADAGAKPGPVQEQAMSDAMHEQNGDEVQHPALKKRRVRFSMKRNLLMQIGGAVPPQEVRTPPGSRPKGSALKRSSLANGSYVLPGSGSAGKRSSQKAKKAASKPVQAQAKLFF